MAKRYINETGLKHLWSKSLNLFAQKNVLNEYAKQKDVDGVKQSLDSKADLVGGKIPESQIPDELKNNSSVAVQEVMAISAEFNFDTGQAQNFSHHYIDIVQAFQKNKVIKFVAKYGTGNDMYQHAIGDLVHYREDEEVLEFIVFVYANILSKEHKLHQFRVVLDKDDHSQTTVDLVDSNTVSGSSDPTQEIVYMDCFIDLQRLTATIEVTYDEIASLIESGKYVVGRGTYALVASPMNLAYLPMSAHNKEESSIYFKGLSQMVLNGVTAVVDITLVLKKYKDNVFKARVVSIAQELN